MNPFDFINWKEFLLSVNEFSCGTITNANPLSLVLPRDTSEETLLIGKIGDKRAAVFIGEKFRFQCFAYDTNESWSGLIVGGVSIEVDEAAMIDPSHSGLPLGAIVREDTQLRVRANADRGIGSYGVNLIDGLSKIAEGQRVGFLKWQVVIGQLSDKRVLATVDVREQDKR